MMSQNRLPPPPPACLWRPYSSNTNRKGGTLVVEDVGDLETHEKRRRDPDGYRPTACPRCKHDKLHVHDYPERKWLAITLVRYLCPKCGATWRMLPMFVARMLWREWRVVEAKTFGSKPSPAVPKIPERTVRRWCARLASAAKLIVDVLREQGAELAQVAAKVGDAATRLQLVMVYAKATGAQIAKRLAQMATIIHQIAPGVRLM